MSDKMGDLGGSLQKLLAEAEKMQASMKQAQEDLTNLTVEGQSGGGMIVVSMNGRHEVSKVIIKKTLIDDGDVHMLEDLVAAAVNHAVKKVEVISKEKITALTAGLNLPTDFMQGGDK